MNTVLKKVSIVLLFLGVVFSFAPVTSAHELIPKALQEYLANNPNATFEDVEAFIQSQSPEIAEKYSDKEKLLKVLRDQNTSFIDNCIDFIKFGIEHILIGLDHILFVLSLLLVFVSLREVLKLTLTFTIAHSITLVLAGASIITLSSRIVEPIIALSISYVAIATVFFANKKFIGGDKAKIATVFIFGLFHGLGFAGLLTEIHIPKEKFLSSLLSFNIGIELGQILIVTLALPFIYFGRNKKWYPWVIKVAAVVMASFGLLWAVQRIIG